MLQGKALRSFTTAAKGTLISLATILTPIASSSLLTADTKIERCSDLETPMKQAQCRFMVKINDHKEKTGRAVVLTELKFLEGNYDPITGEFEDIDKARKSIQDFFLQETGGELASEDLDFLITWLSDRPGNISVSAILDLKMQDGSSNKVNLMIEEVGRLSDIAENRRSEFIEGLIDIFGAELAEKFITYHEIAHGILDKKPYCRQSNVYHFISCRNSQETYADTLALLLLSIDGHNISPQQIRAFSKIRAKGPLNDHYTHYTSYSLDVLAQNIETLNLSSDENALAYASTLSDLNPLSNPFFLEALLLNNVIKDKKQTEYLMRRPYLRSSQNIESMSALQFSRWLLVGTEKSSDTIKAMYILLNEDPEAFTNLELAKDILLDYEDPKISNEMMNSLITFLYWHDLKMAKISDNSSENQPSLSARRLAYNINAPR